MKTRQRFSPALVMALEMLAAEMQERVRQLLVAEAAALKLPRGTFANAHTNEWIVPK